MQISKRTERKAKAVACSNNHAAARFNPRLAWR